MIFRQTLFSELMRSMLMVFLVLLGVILTSVVIRLLGQAAGGAVAVDTIIALVAFRMLHYLPALLTLSLFVAVLMVFSRLWRDSEMIVWMSAGQSLVNFIRPALYFAAPVLLAVTVLSLWLAPWAEQRSHEYRQTIAARSDLAWIKPGVFHESGSADRVYFVERAEEGGADIRNIFVRTQTPSGLTGIIVAREGLTQVDQHGNGLLVLRDGRRYEGTAGAADFRIFRFASWTIRVQTEAATRDQSEVRALPTLALLQERSRPAQAELFVRLSQPVAAVLLVLLAIPLSYVAPRSGRSQNLIAAILGFLVYNNLLSVSRAWIATDKVAPLPAFAIVHGLLLLIIVFVFWRRQQLTWRWPFSRS